MKPASAKSCPSCGERYDADVLFCPKDGTPLSSSGKNPSFSGSERDPYIGMELGGQIQIRHLIGIGSMGRVYRAFQSGIERDVAVKILHRELSGNADLVSRFHREAKVASRLTHPNVVQVLMTGSLPFAADPRVGGELYLVMEHLDGISLLSALAAAGAPGEEEALPLPRALHIALQICEAAGEAHAQGVVHRDLKPENVMLVRRGEDPDSVKVLDFGIARLDWADRSMATQAGLIFGTAKYISPEGAEGLPVGPPADVYSIATMLYQCLAGRAPFEGDSPVALLVQHTHAPPAELRSIARASYVPAPIAQVIMQNLAKKPERRAADARALGRDLALAVRASGLDPDEIAAQPGVLRGPTVVKLASKARTRALDLSPELAAKIGGVAAAPALESAQPFDPAPEGDHHATTPMSSRRDTAERAGPPSGREHGDAAPYGAEAQCERPSWAGRGAPQPQGELHRPRASRPSWTGEVQGALDTESEIPPAARSSRRFAAGVPDADFDDAPPRAPSPVPSTMQGVESVARPRPRRARIARITAILACAAAVSLIGILGGRHLGHLGASASDSVEDHIGRARDCMRRHAWDAPPGENVKDITAHALARWPGDPRVAEVRREAAARIIADALGRKYAGDVEGAIRLVKLSLELQPGLTTAQHLVAELEGGLAPDVAPAPPEPSAPDPRPPARRGGLEGRLPAPAATVDNGGSARPAGQRPAPTPPSTTEPRKPPAAPGTGSGAVLPPTPPPLPVEHRPPTPASTGPWL